MRTQEYRECAWCGFSFPIKRKTAKYCQPAHRTAAYEARKREEAQSIPVEPVFSAAQQPAQPLVVEAADVLAAASALGLGTAPWDEEQGDLSESVPEEPGAVTTAVTEELRARQRLETPLGRALLVLAHRLDHSQGESGSSVARLVQELRAARTAALDSAAAGTAGGGDTPADPLEARRQERERRRGEVSGS